MFAKTVALEKPKIIVLLVSKWQKFAGFFYLLFILQALKEDVI